MIKSKHRDELINRIKTIQNKDILDEVHRLLDVDIEDDSVFQLNNQQKKEINLAQEQVRQGRGIQSNQADEEVDEWLGK